MPVLIHNKQYKTVAERLAEFHEAEKEGSIITEVIKNEGNSVTIKATIDLGNRKFTGHGMEVIGSSTINKTSALENAETSAVGRALAFYGLAGTEIASADEVANAIQGQNVSSQFQRSSETPRQNEEGQDDVDAMKRREITEYCLAMSGDDKDQAIVLLERMTGFKGKTGDFVPGVKATADLKGKRLEVSHRIIRESYINFNEGGEVDEAR